MTITNGVDADRLKAFIERVERLEEEKAGISADIRDVYAEAKGTGYDVKTMRAIVRLRKIERDDRREQEELLDLYKHALGMLEDLPLGAAAIEREFSPVRRAVRKVQAGAVHHVTPHNPETGEITEPVEVRAFEGIANAENSAAEPAHEAGGAPLHSSVEPAPQSNAERSPDENAALAREFLGMPQRPAPYRVTDPAPSAPAIDPDLSPLLADAAARQAAARRLLGQSEASA